MLENKLAKVVPSKVLFVEAKFYLLRIIEMARGMALLFATILPIFSQYTALTIGRGAGHVFTFAEAGTVETGERAQISN